MITTVTLNPAIDREYFVKNDNPGHHQYIYEDQEINVSPGGKGLISAINLKYLGYSDVQNIGFVGGQQGLFLKIWSRNIKLQLITSILKMKCGIISILLVENQ